jgi:hypothetical protein
VCDHALVVDREGYGPRPDQSDLDRLLEDCRTLSPAGIERIAAAWDRRGHQADFPAAEKAALHQIEQLGRGESWDDIRNRLLGLTERGTPLVAWRAEHGAVGHKAEDALMAAALAIMARPALDRHHARTLLEPMAQALPWLLPDSATP